MNKISNETKKFSISKFLKSKTTITLGEYIGLLQGKGRFVVPDYQRGYVWGQKPRNDYKYDSVTYLIQTLKDAYTIKREQNEDKYVFMQGITIHVNRGSSDLILVDGQQRTTFFYLLLKYLGYEGYLKIHYQIRDTSDKYLENIDIENTKENKKELYQDIFFFQKTICIFKENLKEIVNNKEDKVDFLQFVLSHVKFLVVCIPEEQAKVVFKMLNGNKAKMKEEELIKSELLRCASLKHDIIKEAEHAMVRNRLAREWDAWLHWWNKDEIINFFKTNGVQLGWLLPLTLQKTSITFEEFRDKILNETSIQQSKAVFKKMRLLQKSIEDAYNKSQSYNFIGAIIYIKKDSNAIFSFLRWYFNIETELISEKELERYYEWTILGVNHENIVKNNIEEYNKIRREFRENLEDNLLFMNSYSVAFNWLLFQNIRQDNIFDGRKFDFCITKDRSLEHIYPKSKIGHRDENGVPKNWNNDPIDDDTSVKLWRENIIWEDNDGKSWDGSEHCIGNLVLLYKRDNSKFNDADFDQKNLLFFSDFKDEAFKSRHLIHTTMIFSQGEWRENNCWNPAHIAYRKHVELLEFDKYYPVKTENDHEK